MSDNNSQATIITGMTNAGLAIVAKTQIGQTTTFTKLKVGDGAISTETPAELEDLIHTVDEMDITSCGIEEEHTISISGLIRSGTTGYFFREIGLFAIDPETGNEVLYAYGNKGDKATYIPEKGASIAVEEDATILVKVADAENVEVTYSPTIVLGANKDLSNLSMTGEAKLKSLCGGIFYEEYGSSAITLPDSTSGLMYEVL